MAKKYPKEYREKLRKMYTEDHLTLSEIADKEDVGRKTIYRYRRDDKWDEYLKQQAKTMYLEERCKINDIAVKLRKPENHIKRWKEDGKWDKEIFIIGNIGLSRELNTEFVKAVRQALKEQKLTDPGTVDRLSKLLKVIEKLNPERIQLANIFQLLRDVADFVSNLGDDSFTKSFQKHLPDIADHLREKYAS